jgi:uncharacterized membrane protein YvbJ
MTWHDDDDGPSDDDLDRFGNEDNNDGWCPDCGEPCWDEAECCDACGNHIGGRVLSKPKVEHDLQHRFMIVVIVLVLIAFGLVFVL